MPAHTPRSLVQRARNRIAAGDMERLADEVMKAVFATRGYWGGGWTHLLDEVRGLSEDHRASFVDAFVRRFHGLEQGSDARAGALGLLGMIGADPSGELLADERRAELDRLGRRVNFWQSGTFYALAEAELASGRSLPAPVVAVFRRSAMDSYCDPELVTLTKTFTEPLLNVGEAWADSAMTVAHAERETAVAPTNAEHDTTVSNTERTGGGHWHALLAHALTATASKPSPKWDDAARALVDALGAERVRGTVLSWLALVGRPRTLPLERQQHEPDVNQTFDAFNATALRGLVWLVSLLPPHPETTRALGALVESSLRKVAGVGPRSPKVANASVVALTRIDGDAALAELARLATRVTYKPTAKLVDTALTDRATALGLGREEIEELAVPAYGLTDVGHAEYRLGDVTAEIRVHGSRAVLTWRNPTGKTVRSVPAAVRRDHAEEVKELKATVKDIDRMLTAQSERLDRQFLARRTWAYDTWRQRYLDHPLVGTLARRLLWVVDGTTVGWADGAPRTLTGEPVNHVDPVDPADPAGGPAQVELWHPLGRDPAEVVAWRGWLERHAITQPFKQAHREVYPLTDAERATATYSNRFAGHILRQHQFHSLAAIRGWRNRLRLSVDDVAPPATRELPQWGLRAEYWIEGEGHEYGEDTTDSGAYLRLRTDQVRFYPLDAPQNQAPCWGGAYAMWLPDGRDPVDPAPLTGIPPLVLSEVLRDVDLFVGVASVGNDPTWQDGGPEGRFVEYWTSYGFGELDQSAETRRTLLERLVPRLAIADRCTLEGRFLQVEGALHTYRIHLGSGNILMSPNDRYLCIVPKSTVTGGNGTAQTGYLPYEGDRMLAVILSKAMLLAKDTEITDPTVVSQL
ncbi:DUF4132 domain-containing protein [Streptomyces caniscabiei]|uniref:DUF4132 domain-containing protein n=1 Tax=Streptomyces caniscabiei TaxID=2746961 RepID=UPI0029BC83E5|nr:DUF4132 domain-containing protein [Streptomyces caniscabiei]MDX2601225.1 DUF4132 domain-containing protein [Streptomyces caniscabiei]MDX2738959.1 DUF4132 domain-containing protein [Streptomyces caniscabiei]MDX2781822.1 DUF4132 domain-containing protein [Streptomyces caniscabiei]